MYTFYDCNTDSIGQMQLCTNYTMYKVRAINITDKTSKSIIRRFCAT